MHNVIVNEPFITSVTCFADFYYDFPNSIKWPFIRQNVELWTYKVVEPRERKY